MKGYLLVFFALLFLACGISAQSPVQNLTKSPAQVPSPAPTSTKNSAPNSGTTPAPNSAQKPTQNVVPTPAPNSVKTSAPNSIPNPDSLLGVAQKAAYKNHFDEANRIMLPLLKKYPNDPDYITFYGALCSWMGKYDTAKVILRKVLKAYPNNLDAYDALTDVELWTKEDSMAIVDCHKALLIPKVDAETYVLKIAEAKKDLNKLRTAYDLVKPLLLKNPNDTSARIISADILAAIRQKTADSLFDSAQHSSSKSGYIMAEKIARQLSLKYPTNSDFKILWSSTLTHLQKTDTARIMLKQVIAAEPQNLDAYQALADNELIAENYKQALSVANTGIKLPVKGDRTDLMITKASAEDNLRHYSAGLKTIDTVLKKHPENKDAIDLYKLIHEHMRQKTADSLYAGAQRDATKKRYGDAELKMDTITKWYPNNTDYLIFKGKVFCWEDVKETPAGYDFKYIGVMGQLYSVQYKYDTGVAIISRVIKKEPHNMDAYDALTDVELLKNHYSLVVADCDKALKDSIFAGYPSMMHPQKIDSASLDSDEIVALVKRNDSIKKAVKRDTGAQRYYTDFMVKRANALFSIENDTGYRQSLYTLDTLRKVNDTNKDANNLHTEAKIKVLKNSLQLGYLNNSFTAAPFGPWHYVWLQYMRNFQYCPVSAQVSYASIYSLPVGWRQGLQYEVGAYPKFSTNTYGDATVAYSYAYATFPQWNANADLYQKLSPKVEVSIGLIYMHFIDIVETPPIPPQDVWIFDPSITYFATSKFSISYRPYFALKSPAIYVSQELTLKYSFKNEESYLALFGVLGSEPFVDVDFPLPQPTYVSQIGLEYQTRLPDNWLIGPMVSYEYFEYYPPTNLWGNMYYIQMVLTKRF